MLIDRIVVGSIALLLVGIAPSARAESRPICYRTGRIARNTRFESGRLAVLEGEES